MSIFLDPSYREVCTVWWDDGNVQTLKGNIEEICTKIKNYVIYNYCDEDTGEIIRTVQVKDVYLDTMGIGMSYVMCLSDMGVKFKKCTYNKIIY